MDVKFMLSQFSYEHNGYWWKRNGPFVYLWDYTNIGFEKHTRICIMNER